MPRSMVGLLAAVRAAMSALAALAHVNLIWVTIVPAATKMAVMRSCMPILG